MTPSYRRYWLAESVPALRAQERLESGGVSLEDIEQVAMTAFGDEELALRLKVEKMKAMNRQRNLRGE